MTDDIDPASTKSTLFTGAASTRQARYIPRQRRVHGVRRDDTTTQIWCDEKTRTARSRSLPRPPSPPLPSIHGYDLLRRLGQGGMGVVYLAKEKGDLRRLVALKVIHPSFVSDETLGRFAAVAQHLSQNCYTLLLQRPHRLGCRRLGLRSLGQILCDRRPCRERFVEPTDARGLFERRTVDVRKHRIEHVPNGRIGKGQPSADKVLVRVVALKKILVGRQPS